MCELFAVTSDHNIELNWFLKNFFDHSSEHPNGWGLAFFDEGNISVEKEPVRAKDSYYLRHRLTDEIRSSRMMAHIRRATVGDVNFNNTHPFTAKDDSGRKWTLMHNGTIFESEELKHYQCLQKGTTDSERILLYIVDRMNSLYRENDGSDDPALRFWLMDEIVQELSPQNKINLVIFDGEYFYIHKNEEGTLFKLEKKGSVIFSTRPLTTGPWEEIPRNQLFVYKDGNKVFEGARHDNTYIINEENMRTLYMGYAGL